MYIYLLQTLMPFSPWYNGDVWCKSKFHCLKAWYGVRKGRPYGRVEPSSYWLWFPMIVKTHEHYFLLHKNQEKKL